jgi:hypothetical protein
VRLKDKEPPSIADVKSEKSKCNSTTEGITTSCSLLLGVLRLIQAKKKQAESRAKTAEAEREACQLCRQTAVDNYLDQWFEHLEWFL